MTSVSIPHTREDTKTVVKAAFEDCPEFKTYHDNGTKITGKTGASLGLIKSSYGEKVIVDIPESQSSHFETMVYITGEKEVGANIGANPDKYVTQLHKSINAIKGQDIQTILEVLEDENIHNSNKEVRNESQQVDGSWVMIVVFAGFMFLMMMIIII